MQCAMQPGKAVQGKSLVYDQIILISIMPGSEMKERNLCLIALLKLMKFLDWWNGCHGDKTQF